MVSRPGVEALDFRRESVLESPRRSSSASGNDRYVANRQLENERTASTFASRLVVLAHSPHSPSPESPSDGFSKSRVERSRGSFQETDARARARRKFSLSLSLSLSRARAFRGLERTYLLARLRRVRGGSALVHRTSVERFTVAWFRSRFAIPFQFKIWSRQ